MLTLPYDFDTTVVWQRIVKITAALVVALLASIIAAAALGHWGAVAGIAIAVAILAWLANLVRGFPGMSFGAAGRLTADAIETCPVSVWGLALRVPVGRYPISQFSAVRVVQQIIFIVPNSRSNEDIGGVRLVGRDGTPDVEIMSGPISDARSIAADVASKLGLGVERTATEGEKIVEVKLGS